MKDKIKFVQNLFFYGWQTVFIIFKLAGIREIALWPWWVVLLPIEILLVFAFLVYGIKNVLLYRSFEKALKKINETKKTDKGNFIYFSDYIYDLRVKRHITLDDAAAGISSVSMTIMTPIFLSQLENDILNPTETDIIDIANFYHVNKDKLCKLKKRTWTTLPRI
jgi:hypothetical protein